MTQYLITKREKCPDGDENGDHSLCCDGNGYIGTPVDLLEVLAKVRWYEPMGDGVAKVCGFEDLWLDG